MNFNRNDLIDIVLERNFETFAVTQDTFDYVPQRYIRKIHRFIFRNLKRQFRLLKKEDRRYQRQLRRGEIPVERTASTTPEDEK